MHGHDAVHKTSLAIAYMLLIQVVRCLHAAVHMANVMCCLHLLQSANATVKYGRFLKVLISIMTIARVLLQACNCQQSCIIAQKP